MPNRILREGINSSPRIDSLSEQAELLYRRLMSVVDDYGRFYASPQAIRGACWPISLRAPSEQSVSKLLAECSQLIRIYQVNGVKYLEMIDFRQQTRSKSKFPEPDINLISDCEQSASNCTSLVGYEGVVGDVIRYSETETRSPKNGSRSADAISIIEEIQKEPAFAGLNVAAEYERCRAWCHANRKQEPSKRRLLNWCLRAQGDAPIITGFRPSAAQEALRMMEEDEKRDSKRLGVR